MQVLGRDARHLTFTLCKVTKPPVGLTKQRQQNGSKCVRCADLKFSVVKDG